MARLTAFLATGALLAACTSSVTNTTPGAAADAGGFEMAPAPSFPDGSLPEPVAAAARRLMSSAVLDLDLEALSEVASSGDSRMAWLVSDLLRFFQVGRPAEELVSAFFELTGVDPATDPSLAESRWRSVTDHLLAWNLPAPPGYQDLKKELFLLVEPKWEPFFSDSDADIDWRWLSWGGVFIDDRPLGSLTPCPRGCIPALDDPALVEAAAGDWYPDANIVFGVVVNGEAVAFPKNIMEVHEMVNVTIDGRRLGIPYCTLCGSAQAYYTDGYAGPIVLRTSGLLSRSNKVMYDLVSRSVFDTFTGRALSGPLQDASLHLEQATVVSSRWGEWKEAHPQTRIVAEDGGIGRTYPDDPLRGRDDAGPIFPVGPVDPRLPVQAQVVGVVTDQGPVAFPVDQIRGLVDAGEEVTMGGVTVAGDGGGFRTSGSGGEELPSHQAFWFAWSQFHPDTLLWTPIGGG